jgi:hypothetical protein
MFRYPLALTVLPTALLLGVRLSSAVTPTQECQAQKAIATGEWQLCLGNARANALRGLQSKPRACTRALRTELAAIDASTGVRCGYAVSLGGPRRTGGAKCYNAGGGQIACTGTGQDGETQTGTDTKFVDNGDGTISDVGSGLTWEKLSDDDSIHDKDNVDYTWSQALAKIASLNAGAFAGYSDWRIPNVRELETLVNLGNSDPAVPGLFATNCGFHSYGNGGCTILECSCTRADNYWSSTPAEYNTLLTWTVDFFVGQVTTSYRTNSGAALRAVRGGL